MLVRSLWLSLPGFTIVCNRGLNCTWAMTAGKNMPEDNFVKPRKLKRSLVEWMKNIKVGEPRDKKEEEEEKDG